jgi:glycosyltransferase involved in cell wall biosynthesis
MPRNRAAVARTPSLSPGVALIVHSHLRWDFVWQRPQQLLSRLARTNPVLFIEEPILTDDTNRASLDLSEPSPNVIRAVPRLPRTAAVDPDVAANMVRGLVREARNAPPLADRLGRVIQWFYTPMPCVEMLGAFGEEGVVYDCMDELSQFRFAPTDLAQRERLLLDHADVVFVGGRALFESKSRFHDNVHFFGCGVDADHFGRARLPETEIARDVAGLSSPKVGYIGVIDERVDYELIRAMAVARPDWNIVMVGPVVKVDPAELPTRPNIHWLGQRDYADLPRYIKAFDVCLMPFALNEATQFINPTKTLEYLATGKPVVSTAIGDVVRGFSAVVDIAPSTHAFVAAVARAIAAPDPKRQHAGLELASASSWDTIVTRMRSIIGSAIHARRPEDATPLVDERAPSGASRGWSRGQRSSRPADDVAP